jgi:sulfur relay (sulfurtransferase) DsrC/TusE family protein
MKNENWKMKNSKWKLKNEKSEMKNGKWKIENFITEIFKKLKNCLSFDNQFKLAMIKSELLRNGRAFYGRQMFLYLHFL